MLYVSYLRAYTTMPHYDDSLGGPTDPHTRLGNLGFGEAVRDVRDLEPTSPSFRRVLSHLLRSMRRHG